MRVAKLVINNFQNIRKMVIEPDADRDVFKLIGENGAGKSSVLKALGFLLPGKTTQRGEFNDVLNNEAKNGFVTAEIGDFILTRKISEKGNRSVEVSRKDGSPVREKPTALIQSLVGELGLDVGKIITMDQKKISDLILEMFGLKGKLANLRAAEKELYDERTIIGRDRDRIGEPLHLPKVEKVSIASLSEELRAIQIDNNEYQKILDEKSRADKDVSTIRLKIESLESELSSLKLDLSAREAAKKSAENALAGRSETDTAPILEKIRNAESINEKAAAYEAEQKKIAEKTELSNQYAAKTIEVEKAREAVKSLFKTIEWPMNGLSFDADNGLLYDGVSNISSGNLIKIAFSMVAMSDPKLKVVLVPDASLLDEANKSEIERIAREMGFQVFLEIVNNGQVADESTYVIHAGELVGV